MEEHGQSMEKALRKHGEAEKEAAKRVPRHSTLTTENPRRSGSGICVLKRGWGM
jgi:hypothetical protein